MPFVLHPSGYCVWFNDKSKGNLITGEACPICKRTAGHHYQCLHYKQKETTGASSRPKLYNAISVLWVRSPSCKFITFTLPSRPGEKTYQVSPHCEKTGDLAVTRIFSKMLHAIKARIERSSPPNGVRKFSYVWTSEAQMKRQEKFGGVGDLHFHLVTNSFIPIAWLQSTWASYFPGSEENRNAVHVEKIPLGIKSIPAYLVKYLGKGSPRQIFSRRFGSTRDLSALVPIQVKTLPASLQPITAKMFTRPDGYEVTSYCFDTSEILRLYSPYMVDEKAFQGTRAGRNFTQAAINSRKFKREVVQNQQRYAQEHGLIWPGSLVGLSKST